MVLTPRKINLFMFFKLPAAFWCGVRAKSINKEECWVSVTHRWINQNPFRSMYFAVQSMAAELSTGALVLNYTKASGHNFSILIAQNKASYSKKATGKITFKCQEGRLLEQVIQKAIRTKEGQTIWLKSIGTNEKKEQVAEMDFEWSLIIKTK